MSLLIHKEPIVSLAGRDLQLSAAVAAKTDQQSHVLQKSPSEAKLSGREKEKQSRMEEEGALPVSAGASHPRALFFQDLSTERLRSAHTERPVWAVRFTIATFHLHSSSPVGACCLQLLSLFSPVVTTLSPLRQVQHRHRHQTPFLRS